jgi:hypothetical protein
MTAAEGVTTYREDTGAPATESVGLSHLSLELGHLYMEDFGRGVEYLTRYFEMIRPWVDAAKHSIRRQVAHPRISTCFLVDDYFSQLESPEKIIRMISEAAENSGVEIDYLARESGCAQAHGLDLAELLMGYLVPEPLPNSNGSAPPMEQFGWLANGERTPDFHGARPPAMETGWLSNHDRTPEVVGAMAMTDPKWRPPSQSAPNRHAIFMDVELTDGKQWSCAYLAAVWQCLRLGLLRNNGRQVVHPMRVPDPVPVLWSDLPAVLQLSENPKPFCAYRTMSILGSRFVEIEAATRVILGQVAVPLAVAEQLQKRAAKEQPKPYQLPAQVLDRIDYLFTSEDPADLID